MKPSEQLKLVSSGLLHEKTTSAHAHSAGATIERLAAAVAALELDARRYRWLRGNMTRLVCDAPGSESPRKVREVWVQERHAPTDAESVDAAVDIEMAIVPAVGAA